MLLAAGGVGDLLEVRILAQVHDDGIFINGAVDDSLAGNNDFFIGYIYDFNRNIADLIAVELTLD